MQRGLLVLHTWKFIGAWFITGGRYARGLLTLGHDGDPRVVNLATMHGQVTLVKVKCNGALPSVGVWSMSGSQAPMSVHFFFCMTRPGVGNYTEMGIIGLHNTSYAIMTGGTACW